MPSKGAVMSSVRSITWSRREVRARAAEAVVAT